MLVIERTAGERIHIGDDVVVVVLAIKPSRVTLGIKGPLGKSIYRQEVYERIAKGRPPPDGERRPVSDSKAERGGENSMDRDEWLRRYRARIRERRPDMSDTILADLTGHDTHEALNLMYPDTPEQAVDDNTDFGRRWAKAD